MNRKQLLSTTFAAILATGMVTTGATSAFAKPKTSDTQIVAKNQAHNAASDKKEKQTEKDLVKVSEDAMLSMRDLHGARLAIFNGETDKARTYLDAAMTRINVASNEAQKYALDIKAPKEEDNYVPFDVSLTELDAFQATDDKIKHSTGTKHQLHSKQAKDKETLKLSEIDVALSTGMIPVDFAKLHIKEASSLLKDGKYYEANMALKAVDDSVLIQSFALKDLPKVKNQQAKVDNKNPGDSNSAKKG